MRQYKNRGQKVTRFYSISLKSKLPHWVGFIGNVLLSLALLSLLSNCTLFPKVDNNNPHIPAPTKIVTMQGTSNTRPAISITPSAHATLSPTPSKTNFWKIVTPTLTPTPTPSLSPTISLTPILRNDLAKTREKDGMEMVYVPAGEFIVGSSQEDIDALMRNTCPDCNPYGFEDEMPKHSVYLDGFWIDKYEVTNQQFSVFVKDSGYETDAEKAGYSTLYLLGKGWQLINGANWQHPQGPGSTIHDLMQHPVVHVSQHDAQAYCEWVGGRLPTEAEWEKAARGPNGRIYPWGNEFDSSYANVDDETIATEAQVNCGSNGCDGFEQTSPVGSFPKDASVYGVMDMAGNVLEYTNSFFKEYPYDPEDGREDPNEDGILVLRGGSWLSTINHSAYRTWGEPNISFLVGFRCVLSEAP